MAKMDPKDDRIAELELMLGAANEATVEAQSEALQATALRSEIATLQGGIKTRDARILTLEGELTALREKAGNETRATVKDLGKQAVQLKVSSLVTNSKLGQPVTAIAGDVLAEESVFEEVATKVGAAARVHPVSKEEIEAAKKSGRAF